MTRELVCVESWCSYQILSFKLIKIVQTVISIQQVATTVFQLTYNEMRGGWRLLWNRQTAQHENPWVLQKIFRYRKCIANVLVVWFTSSDASYATQSNVLTQKETKRRYRISFFFFFSFKIKWEQEEFLTKRSIELIGGERATGWTDKQKILQAWRLWSWSILLFHRYLLLIPQFLATPSCKLWKCFSVLKDGHISSPTALLDRLHLEKCW